MSYLYSSPQRPRPPQAIVQKYASRLNTNPRLSYPLTLYPNTTIQIYQDRKSTPLKVPCRHCSRPTAVSLTQQKLFLVAERLLWKGVGNITEIERNQTNTWAVNYEVGIYEPFVEQTAGFKNKILENRFYPFVDEFELEVVTKLLQRIGGGLGEKSLNLYLQMLKGVGEIIMSIIPPVPVQPFPPCPTFETPGGLVSQIPPFPPVTSPPNLSSQFPIFSSSPPEPSSSPASPNRLPPLYCPPPAPIQLPSLPRILEPEPPLRSFNDLKELFEVFDKIVRGSYTAVRLMEAYADAIINEACADCWVKYNIVDGGEVDDSCFVDPFPFAPVVQGQPVGPAVRIDPHTGIPMTVQQPYYQLPEHQIGRVVSSGQPFEELVINRGDWLERPKGVSRVEEEELERRWKERARKREAMKTSQSIMSEAHTKGSTGKQGWGEGGSQKSEVIVID